MKRFGTGTDFDNRIATQNYYCQKHSQHIRNTLATHILARIVKPAEYTQTQRHLVLPLTPTAQEFVRAERPPLHQFCFLHPSDDLASAQGHTPGRCVGERCLGERCVGEMCRVSADSHNRLQAPPVVGLFCFYSRSLFLADSHGRLEYH
jgi:hypothetical protein